MSPALPLLVGSSLALAGLGLVPRAGEPVLLAFAPGANPAGAFGAEGWRVADLFALGPIPLALAAPDGDGAEPSSLRRAAGAWLALRAAPAGRRFCQTPPPNAPER